MIIQLIIRITIIAWLFSVISSCGNKTTSSNSEAVARAYDQFLYKKDIASIIPAQTSAQDSVRIAKSYIENWMHNAAILHKASENIKNDNVEIQRQVEEYRQSLVRYAYEKELVAQKLDTNVTEAEINQFYATNQDNFQLKDNIIKVLYLKILNSSPKIDKAKEWIRSNLKSDRKLLEEYAHQFALNYYLDDESWLQFEDLLKEIPIKTYDAEQYLTNNRYIEIEDSMNIYLVNIKGFKIKNSVSPLSYESKNIRNLILNQRKLKLINEMEKSAITEALNANELQWLVK
ncbi:MAG: hypothetical protein RIQ89_973 [Bacteroidota bacterium]|jgi:hypothetical protein